MRKKHISFSIVGLVVLSVVIGNVVQTRRSAHIEAEAHSATLLSPVSVRLVQATKHDVGRYIRLPGDVEAWQQVTLYAKVAGYLESIKVDKGDQVHQGELLAVIHAPELQATSNQASQTYQSSLTVSQSSRTDIESAKIQQERAAQRYKQAADEYSESPALVTQAESKLDQARSGLEQTKEQKKQAQSSLSQFISQAARAEADLKGFESAGRLADITYQRYLAIYNKNPQLIARQDVDIAQSQSATAQSRIDAAKNSLEVAKSQIDSARSQIEVSKSLEDQANAKVKDALQQITITKAQNRSSQDKVSIASADVNLASRQYQEAVEKSAALKYQAAAGASALVNAQTIQDYTHIQSPLNGVVTMRYVDAGAFIQAASTTQSAAKLITVSDISIVRVYLYVPESEARYAVVGTSVTLNFASLPGKTITAKISRTSSSLDEKTRTLLAEVDLPNVPNHILIGTSATAMIQLEVHRNVVSVPNSCIGTDKAGSYVYADSGGEVRKIDVVTGFNDGTRTEIQSGLAGDERIITGGIDTLYPGKRIRSM